METFEKNVQIHGTTIQSLSKKNAFGYRVCHITRNWSIFHKLSDKTTVWKYITNITASTIMSI